MPSRKHFRTWKKLSRHDVKVKGNKSKSPFGNTKDLSILDLENINEILRVHKTQMSTGKTWKVLPKDSCEVYKERQIRAAAKQGRSRDNVESNCRYIQNKKKVQRKNGGKRDSKTTQRRKKAIRQRQKSPESPASCRTSTMSISSANSSEINYE